MYTNIEIACTDQVLSIVVKPKVASGGIEEDRLHVTFSEEWNGFKKTAIFFRNADEVYSQDLDENDECLIPAIVLKDSGTLYISIYGKKDSTVRTADIVKYKIVRGAVTDAPDPLAIYKKEWTDAARRPFTILVNKLSEYFIKE